MQYHAQHPPRSQGGGEIVVKRVMPRQNEEVNEIWLCDKGRFAYHLPKARNASPSRSSARRKLARASWDAATKLLPRNLRNKKDFVVLASGRLSNEDLFNLKSLADTAGGEADFIFRYGRRRVDPLVGVAQGTNLGKMGKGDAILVVASDLYEEAPIWWLRVKQAADRGATLIVANPRETKLDKFASYTIRYAYGDEVKAIHDLSKKGKIAMNLRRRRTR
jgi:NADH-quinone oxidoreductase subunit G